MPGAVKPLILACCILLGAGAAHSEALIEVIPLKARTPEELIPVLQPLVAPGGTVTGMGSRLVVKAERQQMEQIRSVLAELDRPPRPLLIEVRVDRQGISSEETLGARGRIGVSRSEGTTDVEADLQARLRAARTRSEDDIVQQLRTVEGRPARIDVGQEVPIRQPSVQVYGPSYLAREEIYYRPAMTGFFVIPWVRGDTVTLHIRQHADRYNPYRRDFRRQGSDTTVLGPLGSWITLGASTTDTLGTRRDIGRGATTRRSGERVIEVRVTPMDGPFPVR